MGSLSASAHACAQPFIRDLCRVKRLAPDASPPVRTIELVDLRRAASRWAPVIAALVGAAYLAGVGTAVHGSRGSVAVAQGISPNPHAVEADTIKRRVAGDFIARHVCDLERERRLPSCGRVAQ